MNNKSRKIRIESTLKNHFEPKLLVVRDDSKQHEGHIHVDQGSKETHFYVKMYLTDIVLVLTTRRCIPMNTNLKYIPQHLLKTKTCCY